MEIIPINPFYSMTGQGSSSTLYRVLALMTRMISSSNFSEIFRLAKFVVASYVALIIITALASFGVAGVGGGATFAALTVFSAMGLPVGLVGLLIAIEPLIDMGRTAVNVSGALLSGVLSSKFMNELNLEKYNSKINSDADA